VSTGFAFSQQQEEQDVSSFGFKSMWSLYRSHAKATEASESDLPVPVGGSKNRADALLLLLLFFFFQS
jgi:hypothetical protein